MPRRCKGKGWALSFLNDPSQAEGKPEAKQPPDPGRSLGTWVTTGGTDPGGLRVHREALGAAWECVRLGGRGEALKMVARLRADLEQRTLEGGTGPDLLADVALIRAGTCVVEGFILRKNGHPRSARRSLAEAVRAYRVRLAGSAVPVAQDCLFYGISLFLIAQESGDRDRLLHRAFKALRRAEAEGETSPTSFELLGRICRKRKDLGKAESFMKRAVALDATRPSLHFRLGKILEEKGEIAGAINSFSKAAEAYANAQNNKKALRLLDRIAALDPSESRFQVFRALVLGALGRHEEALALLDRQADDAWTETVKGRVLREVGRTGESAELLRELLRRNPKLAEARSELAATLLAQRKYDDALAEAEKALALQDNLVTVLAVHGQILWALHREKEAVEPFRAFLNYVPGQLGASCQLAELLSVIDRHDEALQTIDGALKLQPGNSLLLGTKGKILRNLKCLEESEQVLRDAVGQDPGSGWLNLQLGETLSLRVRPIEASRHSMPRWQSSRTTRIHGPHAPGCSAR